MTESTRRPVVLVVDDEENIRSSLRMALSYEGYDVRLAANGAEGLDEVNGGGIDAAIVDVMMPVIDGLEMCRTLRSDGNPIPILVLTAKTGVSDRVDGLDAGADDYLTKPFDLDELLARVRALLRRFRVPEVATEFAIGDLHIDVIRRTASRGARSIELTKTEFDLLYLLMSNAGDVMSREAIYEEIWGDDVASTSRSLDVYVSYLRHKTEENGEPRVIRTVRGTGFTLDTGDPDADGST